MRLRAGLGKFLRKVADANGYWLANKSTLPFGIDYFRDVERLSKLRSLQILMFFDVGAHTGETALAAAAKFPDAQIFSFEPNPRAFVDLMRNIEDVARVRAFPLALSDRNGTATFRLYGVLATCNTLEEQSPIAAHNSLEATIIDVPVRRLDDFCAEHGIERIDVLKVDVEGHDLAVLNGADQILNHTQIVYVEFDSVAALAAIAANVESHGLKFIASYPELILTDDDLFVASNALFCR